MAYSFGEKLKESIYDKETKGFKELQVWKTPKYEQSKRKAIELIESKEYGLEEGDFWILQNQTRSGKMNYTGLIISHTACLKINDKLSSKFKPECVTIDKQGYKNSLVFVYSCPEQFLYEVGEVSNDNCKNDYPYAMGFKRLFDRVVLKLSKISFDGIYSEAESDSFKEKDHEEPEQKNTGNKKPEPKTEPKKEDPVKAERVALFNFLKKEVGIEKVVTDEDKTNMANYCITLMGGKKSVTELSEEEVKTFYKKYIVARELTQGE